MNGLTLRISGGGSKKMKNTFGLATVIISEEKCVFLGSHNKEVNLFQQASSVDQQLTSIKNILNSIDTLLDKDLIKFLVLVFLQAEAKHPVKCFLTRYITKSDNLEPPFSAALSEEILKLMTDQHTTYKCYIDVVTSIASCVENFPAGAAAVKSIELPLAEYLKNGLTCIVGTLSEPNPLSPTEKNEVFNLAHSILRLILYIAQKASLDNVDKICCILMELRLCLKNLLFDEDVPMDTKSVCGIVYVSTYILENNSDSWVNVLNGGDKDEMLQSFLENEASRLCLYSAVATVVPTNKLQAQTIEDTPAIILLTARVIGVGERTSFDSTFNLAVTRTLVQISKGLDKTTDKALGLRLVDLLLTYVWVHLDHYMDSVRHLSALALANIVKYCARLQREGDGSALEQLFTSLQALDPHRKSFYVSLTALTAELGTACIVDRMPSVVRQVMDQLHVQAVQASATTALETLLHKQTNVPSNVTYERWIVPILAHAARPLESPELAVLEGLLTKVVKQDESVMEYMSPHIQQQQESGSALQCALMLASVVRRAGAGECGAVRARALRRAAVSGLEQTRILSLSLVVESPRSTAVFTPEELDFVLYFLKYNANSQAPNFRQLVLSLMKKLLKRLEDSYKVFKRQNGADEPGDYYVSFLENLRAQCFDSLIQGANYGRRCVSLQTLAWCERTALDGHRRQWKEDYVEKLLLHLEDSYENNKALALEILRGCPDRLLQDVKYTTSLDLRDILRQASSVKPTDCVSAAYKLSLLRDKLPGNILEGQQWSELRVSEVASYTLLRRLLVALRAELVVCRTSVVVAARDAPMYGLLHCMLRVVSSLSAEAVSQDEAWSALVAEMVTTCIEVNASVACVVNNSSPEGHLPMDTCGVVVSDHGNSGNVRLPDGRPVTAQMVLLCAWRSVKEVSLLLGTMCSRLEISSESPGSPGSLTVAQILLIGDHFTTLLAETKHRGAFEQAYVGFTSLLTRLWRCRSPELHELPRRWLEELMAAIESLAGQGRLCATRRSAGLPFMIQALVTTELQVRDTPSCFHACAASLVRQTHAGAPAARSHCAHVLRALVRTAALRDAVAPHVAAALAVALAGFESPLWEERNSSTLLFSALVVRVFGVQRSRGELAARNRMTGRVFFQRYPALYDLLLGKLQEASGSGEGGALRPALYPVLLLLARLYPSALEGTVSNLKLVAFIPHVLAVSRSADLRVRVLAASAALPLVAPDRYMSHLDTMLRLLADENIERNHCHGILLQVTTLLDNRPRELRPSAAPARRARDGVAGALWVLRQAGAGATTPCYVIADEYLRMISLLLWKFETILDRDITDEIVDLLDTMVFGSDSPNMSGRAVCLANAAYLYFIILNVHDSGDLYRAVYGCLSHECYEVVLSALNYILIMHKQLEIEDKFQEHLSTVVNADVLETLHRPTLLGLLCDIVTADRYPECTQKALKVLTLSGSTQSHIVRAKEGNDIELTDDVVLEKLFYYVENEHENLIPIYLQSLSSYLNEMLRTESAGSLKILEAIRVMFECSSSDNSDDTRRVVVDFLDANIEILLALDLKNLQEAEKFEYKATLYSTLVAMLEDEAVELGQRTSELVSRALREDGDVVPGRCARVLREHVAEDPHAVALLAALALIDFRSQVVMTDEGNDECRVFDQNEKYNINLEETVWTRACADKIKDICKENDGNLVQYVLDVTSRSVYKPTLDNLCGDNLTIFGNVQAASSGTSVMTNPKIQLFVNELNNVK